MKRVVPCLAVLCIVLFLIHTDVAFSQNTPPLIKVIATGGTIANTPGGQLSGEAYTQAIPEIKKYARLEVVDLMNVASPSIGPDDWLKIGKTINEILAKEEQVKGIVVTHGSNILDETAYFLNLVVKSDKPVVLVAAQRKFTSLSSDSPKNFLQAVQVASSDKAIGKGVLIVLNDEISAARDARKVISYRMETIESGDLGSLGYVDDFGVEFYRAPLRKHTKATEFEISKIDKLPRVDIIYSYAGADGNLLQAAVEHKAEGIVFAGFPTGSPSRSGDPSRPWQDELAKKLIQTTGIPIVTTNRGGIGRILPEPQRAHFILGDNLVPQKARVLLMLALTKTREYKEIQRMFYEY
jgi:L-asparaginase